MNILTNPALLIAVPLLAAFISVIIKKIDKVMLGIAVITNAALSILMAVTYESSQIIEIGGFKPPFGISLVLDEYSLVGIVLLNVIVALILFMSSKNVGKYSVALSVSLAALNGMMLTGDLFNLFVFMEIAAIAAYIMTTANKGYKHTFNYLILGSLASGLFLFGIILLYNMFGSLNIDHISSIMGESSVSFAGALTLPIVLIFAGLSVEAKLIPFGGWVRGVLKKANSLVGALIVSAYALTILMVFGRITGSIFIMNDALLIAFTVIATATLVFAEASAFSKKNIREILLFSSIAQPGLVALLFINGLKTPALLVLINNVVSKLVLFTIAGKIAKDTETDNIYELKGIFSKYVMLGIGFTISALSLIGLPLFFGFVAKINALVALFNADNLWLPIIILLVAIVEGAYIIRMLTNLWNSGEEGEYPAKDKINDFKINGCAKFGIITVIIGLALIAAGILPIFNIKEFFTVDFMTFINQLMGGM